MSSSAAAASSSSSSSAPSSWAIPGVLDVHLEVFSTVSGIWVDSSTNPPLVERLSSGGTYTNKVERHVNLRSLGHTCILTVGESFRIKLTPLGGQDLIVSMKVDSRPVRSSHSRFHVTPKGTTVTGFNDCLTGVVTPFVLKEVEVVEGDSMLAWAAGADAMAKVGRIDIEAFSVIPAEARVCTASVQADASSIKTSEKKSLLNGLGTAVGKVTTGVYTYTSAPFTSGPLLGTTKLSYRDHSAVLLIETGEEALKKKELEKAGGGSGGGGESGSKRKRGE